MNKELPPTMRPNYYKVPADLKPGKRPKSVSQMLRLGVTAFDPVHRRQLKRVGVYSHQNLYALLCSLFIINEKLKPEEKKTDEQLKHIVLNDFPDDEKLHRSFHEKNWQMNYYRQKYNSGKMTNGMTPEHISFRYNALGQPINGNNRVLSREEVEAHVRRYKGRLVSSLIGTPTNVG